MDQKQKIRWSFFVACLILVPLTSVLSQSGMTCHMLSLLVPIGGHAQIMDPTSGITPAGERSPVYIRNDYLGRLYQGGKAYDWLVASQTPQTFSVRLEGRLGGKIERSIVSEEIVPGNRDMLLAALSIPEKIIGGDGPTAELVPPDLAPNQFDSREAGGILPVPASFPITCPRLASTRHLLGLQRGIDPSVVSDPNQDWYEGTLDSKNQPPDDILQNGWTWNFDCHNVLCINKATTRFDWEDERIVIGTDAAGGDVTEAGAGGLYANFHYAVVPCKNEYHNQYQRFVSGLPGGTAIAASQLMRCANRVRCTEGDTRHEAYQAMQFLLHLAQGNLDEIGRGDQSPELRAHGMLPGPFLSKTAMANSGYDQCEWLDTRYHAPNQSVNYRNFCIWDWDSDTRPSDQQCVMVLLWEGDGASTGFARRTGAIGSTDVADDFIGFFEVRRANTLSAPLEVSNYSSDVTLGLTTGDATCR